MVDYTDRFSCVEPSLHLGNESYLIMVDDLCFATILLSILASIFIREIGLKFAESLHGLGIRVTVNS